MEEEIPVPNPQILMDDHMLQQLQLAYQKEFRKSSPPADSPQYHADGAVGEPMDTFEKDSPPQQQQTPTILRGKRLRDPSDDVPVKRRCKRGCEGQAGK